jgi:hypothetical protein
MMHVLLTARTQVVFAAPLVFRHGEHFFPLALIDYAGERALIARCLREAHPGVAVDFDFATTPKLCQLVALGYANTFFLGSALLAVGLLARCPLRCLV